MGIESLCPEPDENGLPARMDLHFVSIFRLIAQVFQHDQVIPDGNMPVVLTTLYPVLIEPLDPDCMNTEWNEPKESETIRRNGSFPPRKVVVIPHGRKCRMRSGNILERFQSLQVRIDLFPRCRKYG